MAYGSPQPLRRRMLACLALALAGMPVHMAAAAGQAEGDLERSVKAAFLYKFLLYTEFPDAAFGDAGAPLVIGVVAADELARELARIVSGRNVQKRTITVRVLRENEIPAGIHLLFVGGADPARVKRVLKAAPDGPTLVVTEADSALQSGSIINFRIVAERVRFDVALEAADKKNIKLSSRLLTVANNVQKGAP
jgi:hypothetical protein